MLAVAYSIEQRVIHPGWWGEDIMSVVFHRWQYSSMTNPRDANTMRWPEGNDSTWQQALQAASDAITHAKPNPVPTADSFYDDSITTPDWAKRARFVKKIQTMNFYCVDYDHESA